MSIDLQRDLCFILHNRNETNQNVESVNSTQNPAITKQEILALVCLLVSVLGKLENTLKKSIEKLAEQLKQLMIFESRLIHGQLHISPSRQKQVQKAIKNLVKNIKTIVGKEQKEIGALHSLVMSLEKLIKKPTSLMSTQGEQLLAQILSDVERIAKAEHSEAQFQKS